MDLYIKIQQWCCPPRGICLSVLAIPLFISVYILISLNLDAINTGGNSQSLCTRETKIYIHSLIKMQRAVDDLHTDLSRVTMHRDFLVGKIAQFVNNTQRKGRVQETKYMFDLPYIFQEHHFGTFESLIHHDFLLTCDQMDAIHLLGSAWKKSNYTTMQFGFYGFQEVFLVKRMAVIESCPKSFSVGGCELYANYYMMKEILLLHQLQETGVVRLLGMCVILDPDRASVSYVIEGGTKVNMTHLKEQPWNKRITILKNLIDLTERLYTSSLGRLGIKPITESSFMQVSGSWVKLADLSTITYGDPRCDMDTDCYIEGNDIGITCGNGQCVTLTRQRMVLYLHQNYFHPLLSPSPPHSSSQTASLLRRMRGGKLTPRDIAFALEAMKVMDDSDQTSTGIRKKRKLKEKSKFTIAIHKDIPHLEDDEATLTWPGGPDVYKFKYHIDADLPNQFDYFCPRSQASWGCMVVVQSMQEALTRCTGDPQCQAFIVVQHPDREDWLTVTLKNGYSNLVPAEGSIVYIKHPIGSADDDVSNKMAAWKEEENEEDLDSTLLLQPCLDDVIQSQRFIRMQKEKELLSTLGLLGLSESQWRGSVQLGGSTGASDTAQAVGQRGGRMLLHMDTAMIKTGLFLAEEGPTVYHLAHLAFHHLDRILGIYRTSPSALRQISASDLNLLSKLVPSILDKFKMLISSDKQLTGVITMPLLHKAGKLKRLSLPALHNMTSVILKLSDNQKAQLEYTLLLWLTGTARQTSDFLQYRGEPVHLLADDALHQGVDGLLYYFNHCQFPRHAVEVMMNLRDQASDHCTLASQMFYQLHQSGVSPSDMKLHFKSVHQITLLINRAADKLLELVDKCSNKFGEKNILY